MIRFMGQFDQAVVPIDSSMHLGVAVKDLGDVDNLYNQLILNKIDGLP